MQFRASSLSSSSSYSTPPPHPNSLSSFSLLSSTHLSKLSLPPPMASVSTKQDLPRRLSEVLKEEQEPFVLEIYLLERGFKSKKFELFKKRSKSENSGQLSSIAKSVYSKIVLINKGLGLKSLIINKGRKKGRSDISDDKQVVLESERISSASSSTLCNSCSGSDVERESVVSPPMKNAFHEAIPHRVMTQWRFIEDNKQCSPVSVLDEIDLLNDIPVYNYNVRQEGTPSTSRTRFQNKVSEDLILTASLFELLVQSRKSNPGSDKFPLPMMNSKKSLQQTRQLLFDCVKEVVEMSHKGQHQISIMKRSNQKGLVIGPEEMGKVICNNFKGWGKFSSGKSKTKIAQLLRIDLLGSTEEWASLEECKRDVAWDIGDCILEEITDDIVKDMIDQY